MSATVMGLSTLGVTFGYGVEDSASAGTKPATFKQLDRILSIGGIAMDTEQLDCSTLEDYTTKYIAGRSDLGGSWEVEWNFTEETAKEWEDLIAAYNTASASNLNMWFEVIVPNQSKGFFVVAQPPQALPMPEFTGNEVLTVTTTLVIVDYKGFDTKVDFT